MRTTAVSGDPGRHRFEPAELLLCLVLRHFGHLDLSEPLFQLLEVGGPAADFPKFGLDGAHLLAKVELSLRAIHLLLDLVVDAVL